jgi:glycosyltransferase involved in cell wall biosynthesis
LSTPSSSVVYVALGGRRTRAARRHATDLAAAGAQVLLVVADRPEWADAEFGPGVTAHRLGSAHLLPTLRAARRVLLRRRGPLARADLLIAGDPQAMPIADAARRKYRRLTVRTDPSPGADRHPQPADVAVVTPWYPSPNDPFAGAYVRAATGAVAGEVDRISILHTENWFYPTNGVTGKLMSVTLGRVLEREPGYVVTDTPEGELTRVVTPQMTSGNYMRWARSQVKRLEAALPTGHIEAPLIHAHTGHYAGVVATELARPDARIVLTEHATFLDEVFAQPAARRRYRDTLARVNRVLCVGKALYDQLAEQFPQYVEKLRIVPNPIDFDQFTARAAPPAAPLRWLYVGRMLEHKGVRKLVDGFAQIAAEEPRATLTLVGSGPLERPLKARIAELGLAGRIVQRPAVAPEDVVALMHDHDVLVHASSVETFGITVVEAVATGTPVMVAASQGPAETLAGLDGVAGVLFPVSADPAVVADAYRRLKDGWDSLDLISARELLRARYGREAVGAQLREVYRQVLAEEPPGEPAEPGAEPPPPPAPGADRIAVVAISPPGLTQTRSYIRAARERGYGVDLIALDPGHWSKYEADPGITVHTIGESEERRLTRRLERVLVTTFPRWALGFARARVRGLGSPLPEAIVIHAQRGHRMLANRFETKVYNRWYQIVRPRILWRITRRKVLPQLDLSRTRRVVVNGLPGVTIGWGLAKRDATMPVATDLTPPHEDAHVEGHLHENAAS